MFVPAGRERGRATQYGQVLHLGEVQFGISHAISGFDSDQPICKAVVFASIASAFLLFVAGAVAAAIPQESRELVRKKQLAHAIPETRQPSSC